MPKVSVVIPTYNRGRYISSTIDSVLRQTFNDLEVIVVDDGSTDDTRDQLEKYNSRIKVIHQKNSERAFSRNTGVANSTGKYIAFLDSDDLWLEDKLEKQVEILDESPDTVLVFGQSQRINAENERIETAKRQTKGESGNVFEKLLLRNFIVSATPLLRREGFETTSGFQTQYIPYEDWEFWLRFSLLGKFHFIPEPLAKYRIHPEQSVKLARAEKIEEVTLALLNDSFKLKPISEKIKNKSLGLANLRFCYWYLLANQPEKAREKASQAVSLHPAFLLDPRWYGLRLLCQFPQMASKGIFNLRTYH